MDLLKDSLNLLEHFKNGKRKMIIGIVGRKNGHVGASNDQISSVILNLIRAIIAKGHAVHVESDTFNNFVSKSDAEKFLPSEFWISDSDRISKFVDLVIVVGGDGTMLNTAKSMCQTNPLLLGINMGRLGFITDVPKSTDPFKIIDMLERKAYTIESRTMLSTFVNRTQNVLSLNDVVFSRSSSKIIEFEVYIDDLFAYRARGDGLMISTPTGSTAYALSAGAPIIHPSARVFEIVPMFSQTLSYRPLIVNDTSNVTFKLLSGQVAVLADGIEFHSMNENDSIDVQKSYSKVEFIHPYDDELKYDYYHTLREKLNWQRQNGD